MKLYAWRYEKYRGYVTARDEAELFWAIDAFIDPHCVEIQKVKFLGVCFEQQHEDEEPEKWEIFEDLGDDNKWKKPEWKTLDNYI
jgi:hypothetical protein